MPTVIVKFGWCREHNISDGKQTDFPFELIEDRHVGTPRQSSETRRGCFIVKIVRILSTLWDLEKSQLTKALFQIAKEWLQENLQTTPVIEGNIEILVTTFTHPTQCPYDINLIEEPNGAVVEININRKIGF